MGKKKEVKLVKKVGNGLEIDGKFYLYEGERKGEYMIFKEIGDINKINIFLDNLVKKLEPSLDKKIVLKDALCEVPYNTLKKIDKILETKKPELKTTGGCVELHIGKEIIDVR